MQNITGKMVQWLVRVYGDVVFVGLVQHMVVLARPLQLHD